MDWSTTDMTVADYFAAYERGDVTVNRQYQRSDRVWPEPAKSFLLESILLGYPIPKLSLHQITDVRTRKTRKEVVDGQQRSATIWGYLDNEYRLSTSSEIEGGAGRKYDDLPDELKQRILDYTLSFDLFVATTQEEVREVFRRINSFTVPLNAEEQRHAEYQGLFKWFIYRTAREYDVLFVESGMFTSKQIVRMQDTKWLAEIADALLNEVSTTSKAKLTALYKSHDKTFPREAELESRFKRSLDLLLDYEEIHATSVFKPFAAYAMALAIMHVQSPIPSLQSIYRIDGPMEIDRQIATAGLSSLADALDNPDERGLYGEFLAASAKGTNVKAARETRVRWFCKALLGEL